MTTIENNQAAWLVQANVNPLQVKVGPDQTKPLEDEVIVRVAALAINPSESFIQDTVGVPLPITYPHVLGSDIAGTVVKVGSGVTRFKEGDRVIGHCLGLIYGGARHGGYQNFTALREAVTAKIPDSLSFEKATVLPISISTSATALFDDLKLRLPTPEGTNGPRDEIVLIWGAASSVGSAGVQLAVAAGYKVVTTASSKNHTYVRSLTPGDHVAVFDYAEPNVVSKIIEYIKASGSKFVGGYECVGSEGPIRSCAEIIHAFGGGPLPVMRVAPEGLPEDVKADIVWCTNPGTVPGHPGGQVWEKFVPAALENGSLQAKPDPDVVGKGLEAIQGAITIHKAGVSAKKIVVTL